jgi:hypothetical protein
MPKIAAQPQVPNTATGQAVTRARAIAKKAGAVPAPNAERPGFDEFKPEPDINDPGDPFDGDGSKAAGPEAKKAVAKKTPAKKAAAKKAVAAAISGAPRPASDDFFAPLDDSDDFINVLWYGKEGSTKTTSLATASANCPDGSKILVVNAEGGMKVRALRKHGVDTSKIVVFPNPKTDDVLDDESLERIYLKIQADLIEDPKSWFAVGIDSITDVGQILVDTAQAARVQKLRAAKLDPDKNFVDRDDYGVSAKIIRKHLRRFRDLPCHFMVTALERRDVDEDTSKVTYGPAVSPAVANDLMGYVDIAIMVKAADEDKPVRGLTKEGGKYRVKDRFEILPKVMVEPTFDRIFDYFNDELTPETDPHQESLPAKPAKGSDTLVPEEDAAQD